MPSPVGHALGGAIVALVFDARRPEGRGGFARLGFKFEGELSNRVEAQEAGMRTIADALGAPVRFVQIHGW